MSFYCTPPKHTPTPRLPTYLARDLMQNGDVAQIVLDDQTYTLRVTRAGKLILTKCDQTYTLRVTRAGKLILTK